jgi:hypothetical protein
MSNQETGPKAVFQVIDAMDGPYHGRILRLRLVKGQAPTIRQLKGSRLLARSPRGDEQFLRVLGFPVQGGHTSDARISRTGKVDVLVDAEGNGAAPQASLRWEVTGPL